MKKNIFRRILLAVTLIWGLSSCDHRELTTIIDDGAPVVVDLSKDQLVLNSNLADSIALNVSWTAAKYNIPTELNYTVQVSSDKEFTDPVVLGATHQSITKVSYITSQLNKVAKQAGLQGFITSELFLRVISYVGNNELLQTSNVTSMMVTPYNDSAPLYLVGSATAAGWSNTPGNINMFPLLEDHKNGNVYTYQGFFTEGGVGGGFKMVRTKGSWDAQFGTSSTPGTLSSAGDSGNIQVSVAGYYLLTVDVSKLTYTLEPVAAPSSAYATMGIIGDATPGGWDADTVMTKSSFDPHVWLISKLTLKDGFFKFRANGNWDVSWGGADELFGTATSVSGPNTPVSAGVYDVYFNDASGAYVLTLNK